MIATIFFMTLPLLGPFERADFNPILTPHPDSTFHCPVQEKNVSWEGNHVFNPGAVVRNGKVYLIYRAEDDSGKGLGHHTSRLGLAESKDGIHFERHPTPVLFPDTDDRHFAEWPGGCEDPRIVETEEGTYVMTYTQWNQENAVMGIATSEDLFHWKKQGDAFPGKRRRPSKSGSILCRREGDRLIATKIQGKYWMYWGDKRIQAATSNDLISWEPLMANSKLVIVLEARQEKFDSSLVEPGPPALLTDEGVLLFYNGKNAATKAYSVGQVLLDPNQPTKVLARMDESLLSPKNPYEMKGQYKGGTVFAEGLVHFQDKWFLYYGAADSAVGVAVANDSNNY
jgi:predicted GH43/DUF377 family glycosyl hydrolase